jgi:hypothetical protein
MLLYNHIGGVIVNVLASGGVIVNVLASGGVIANVLASGAVDRVSEHRSDQTTDYKISILFLC